MRVLLNCCLLLLFSLSSVSETNAFVTRMGSSISLIDKRSLNRRLTPIQSKNSISRNLWSANNIEDETESVTDNQITIVSWPYAVAWVGFVAFAFLVAPHPQGDGSQQLIEKFIQNPLNPGINHIFNYIFNLFAWIPFSLSALLMPGAKRQGVPTTPVLLGSSMIGYFILGPYMAIHNPVTQVQRSDLGWFTSNVLENKIFAWFMVFISFSSVISTGLLPGLLTDTAGEIQGYLELVSTTQLASVSSLDIMLLTITAASLIPEDLKRRGVTDENQIQQIAVATLLLPVLGSVLYCALRPSLVEDEK